MPRSKPLFLTTEFKVALNILERTDRNLFITGRAGTGKSTLLQLFRNTTHKRPVVAAPTGIAALNVRGQTIHSLFRFPPRYMDPSEIRKVKFRGLYKKMEVLIIDEISMVRADVLDNIDRFLRINRDRQEPFGGVQIVFFGDLFQLPPVVSSHAERYVFTEIYDSPYFFSAKVFANFEMQMFELQKVFRQEEKHFIRLLDNIRLNRIDYDDLEELNERHLPGFQTEDLYITLCTRNDIANSINQKKIRELPGEAHSFTATVAGEFQPRLYPTDLVLQLKEGAQVMFVRNDPHKRFVNGSLGKITNLTRDYIRVAVERESGEREVIELDQMDWEIIKYKMSEDGNQIESKVIGTFRQYPLKLAWAITIHKSQGKTFEKVIVDLGRGAFESGQTYVALSRCRTLEGIVLKQPVRSRDIMIDPQVVEFYERLLL
jgi:ATP-dependent DNA helicase PIF1